MPRDSPTPFVLLLAAGVAAGGAALVLDQAGLWWTLRELIPLTLQEIAAYLLAGGVLASLLCLRPGGRRAGTVFGRTLTVIYAAGLAERLHFTLGAGGSAALAWLGVVAAFLAIGATVVLLAHIGRSATAAPLLTSLAAAAGLAVNRHLLDRPTSADALVADATIVAIALVAALAVRRFGGLPVAAAGLVIALATSLGSGHRQGANEPQTATAGPPHTFLVIVDTLRADVFADVLASTDEGGRLRAALHDAAWIERAMATAPWTPPSVGSILTGLYPAEHGFGTRAASQDPSRPLRPLASDVPTLASRLSRRGYRTAAVVTNSLLHPSTGIDRGFESYVLLGGATDRLPWLTVVSRLGLLEERPYQPASQAIRRFERGLDVWQREGRPLFTWLHLMDPHGPLHAHRRLAAEPLEDPRTEDERRYRREVRYTAAELAGWIERLDQRGLWQNSLFVLIGDHGEMFPSDGHRGARARADEDVRAGHGHALYEELVKVPLVVRPPGGLPGGRRLDQIASHVDVHDTVVDLLGIDAPRIGRDRTSLAPWLARTPVSGAQPRAFALLGGIQSGSPQRALRAPDEKLILHDDGRAEFYDLHEDPIEARNLAGDVSRRTPLERLLVGAWSTLSHAADAPPVALDEETRRRLRALGYLD